MDSSGASSFDSVPLVEYEGHRVYDVLVDLCGAVDDLGNRTQWACFWDKRHDLREYRFIGSLGFGGKFWVNSGRWYVTCYREDETIERLAIIEAANARLAALLEEYDRA